CPLCNQATESIAHLFFQCTIATERWSKLMQWQGIRRQVMSWNDELDWAVVNYNGKNPEAELYRMVLAGGVYYVWQERNQRVFMNKKRDVDTIIKIIVRDVFHKGSIKPSVAGKLKNL
ncbi:hypothetical protein A4A49_65235, partial [Nicotiana attenuata]